MPDDSTPEQRERQQVHAKQIRFETQLMRETGLTRSQVRNGLRVAQAQFINRVLTQPQVVPQTTAKEQVQILGETNFKAPPILGGESKSSDIAGLPGKVTDCIVLRDGVLIYADLYGKLKDNVE